MKYKQKNTPASGRSTSSTTFCHIGRGCQLDKASGAKGERNSRVQGGGEVKRAMIDYMRKSQPGGGCRRGYLQIQQQSPGRGCQDEAETSDIPAY